MKFGFDIDDTILNLREHAFRIYNVKLNRQVGIDAFRALTTIPIHEAFGLSVEEGRQLWNEHRDEIYYSAPPFDDAVQTLQELEGQGHEIYYVTARNPEHCERTKSALIKAGFPVQDDRFYCGMADSEKVHILRKLGLDYYFDDKPAVLDTLSELEMFVYAKDNPYNRHLNIPRIVNWCELLEIIKRANPSSE
ncbi:5' nucleotidase, NT5C type [Cohnella mopanensis]|uniref:5' nucleotidase, NT5C type n=1 Tax=Cohnella mopanensis TaxID=2911966 RepID=UPI001EF7590A|nr:HAD family acid phosphatase [Cohnella mopanensis]